MIIVIVGISIFIGAVGLFLMIRSIFVGRDRTGMWDGIRVSLSFIVGIGFGGFRC